MAIIKALAYPGAHRWPARAAARPEVGWLSHPLLRHDGPRPTMASMASDDPRPRCGSRPEQRSTYRLAGVRDETLRGARRGNRGLRPRGLSHRPGRRLAPGPLRDAHRGGDVLPGRAPDARLAAPRSAAGCCWERVRRRGCSSCRTAAGFTAGATGAWADAASACRTWRVALLAAAEANVQRRRTVRPSRRRRRPPSGSGSRSPAADVADGARRGRRRHALAAASGRRVPAGPRAVVRRSGSRRSSTPATTRCSTGCRSRLT